ncbi:MAG: S8 family serine peptidase [Bacteroidales bacterium]|nr:S8 family serine peptidase [Bacteroidales bacterium]
MKIGIILLTLIISGSVLSAQTAPDTYWVQFTDKNLSPYTIYHPEAFLSQRALERRERFGIEIDKLDIPVNAFYVDSLKSLGLQILAKSKWFNAVTIYTTDTLLVDTLEYISFVRQVKALRKKIPIKQANDKFNRESFKTSTHQTQTDTTLLDYGQATWQVGMVNGQVLHNQGYQGQGMVIAVLDGGFYNANQNPAFDSLWAHNQILDTWDFVNRGPVTFDQHRHGAQVLSIMGANLPGRLIGTAPKASYILLVSENTNSEYLVEEDYWTAAAEFADSAGADLINSSLGYSIFLDTLTNHTYADMDGNTTRITRAADIAASKGILVVSSAANEGMTSWHYITAPADADSILTVGAVDSMGVYAPFSSTGPTYDGRIKPNITAQGMWTALSATNGSIIRGNGTSFSSPLICGMTACLWQTNKSVNPADLIHLIEQSASQYEHPDSLLGYGIPDYGKALFLVQGLNPVRLDQEHLIRLFPNPFTGSLVVNFYTPQHQEITIELMQLDGRICYRRTLQVGSTSLNQISLKDLESLPAGVLLLRILTQKGAYHQRIIHTR